MEDDIDALLQELLDLAQPPGEGARAARPARRHHVVLMSNGNFGGLAGKLRAALAL